VTLSGTLALREGTFPNDDWLFVCQSLENVVITTVTFDPFLDITGVQVAIPCPGAKSAEGEQQKQ
jgi:hypothetical protein